MKLNIAALLLLVGAVDSASATVSPATVSGQLNLANVVGAPQISSPTTFGTHRLSGPGESVITIGGDAAGTPFIHYAATTPDTTGSTPYVTGTLNYSWEVVSADGSKAPVLVHISTAGWVNARYGFGPYRAGVNLVPNSIDVAATARFMTQTSTGIDQRIYGLQGGGVNMGVTRLTPEDHFTPQVGGYSQVAGNFNTSFDLWVLPNLPFNNTIQMSVYTAFRQDSFYTNDHALEWYDSKGFIDPVITIDPAQAGRYALNVSSIPLAPVPEASTLAMMFSGLAGLLLAVRRRRAAGAR